MRLVEIRLLEGPNLYRLAPVVKVEVVLGDPLPWSGTREMAGAGSAGLGRHVVARPVALEPLIGWIRWLLRRSRERPDGRADGRDRPRSVRVHQGSDPGHWIVTYPWSGAERARLVAEAAFDLAGRGSTAPAGGLAPVPVAATAWLERIDAASASPPAWVRDADRRVPVVSVTGTNGKSTVSRLITHILVHAGKRVGTTTSDGVLVNERLVDPGDWTGPGGAAQILGRSDVDVAVLETARGGILLRGVGYESNEASVLTNVSSDHLDLQGIHTLPELAEVKATVCRITRPDGWVILNADDPWVAALGPQVAARVAYFSTSRGQGEDVRRHVAGGGRAYVVRRGAIVELEGDRSTEVVPLAEVPITLAGLARHNVANALAAVAAARALGASVQDVGRGLVDFRPTTERSPGRLNIFRLGRTVVIVDFAHNEAGIEALFDVAEAVAAGGAARAWPITAIIGTAGDRPDDTLQGIARIAARRAQRVVIKETLHYLRGRERADVVEQLRAGLREEGVDPAGVPVAESETAALRAELASPVDATGRAGSGRVIALMCHEERVPVFNMLTDLGARPVDTAADLLALVPRLQERPRP